MQMVEEEDSLRSLSPMTRGRGRDGGSQPVSPLRSTFTANQLPSVPTRSFFTTDHNLPSVPTTNPRSPLTTDQLPSVPTTSPGESLRPPTAVSVHFGPPTPADFHLSAPRNFGNGAVRSASASNIRPHPLVLRQESDPALRTLARNRDAMGAGIETPPDRRLQEEQYESADEQGRQGSFFSRLKAMATPSHSRQPSDFTNASVAFRTPTEEIEEPRYPISQHDGSEAEGDVEESSMDESEHTTSRPKRKAKRRPDNASSTAPSTPKTPRLPSFLRDHQDPVPRLPRRATMTDIPENSRLGVSEDEGRDRLAAKSAWRRGLQGARGLSYAHRTSIRDNDAEQSDTNTNRPPTGRRFTGFGAFDGSSSPRRMRGERQPSASAQKWKQVMGGLKLLGQRDKKAERVKVDHQKSTELMAELLAGSPAAIFFASMYQRDEHGRRKIPVLLEQLKITIPSSQTRESKSGDRHMVFTINLEYGSGPSRMTWTIHRTLRDFANLHLKYKFQSQTERYNLLKSEDRSKAKIPRFPRSAFPYLRGVRGLADDDDDDDEHAIGDQSGPDGEASGPERPGLKKRRTTSLALSRRKSSLGQQSGPEGNIAGEVARAGSVAGAPAGSRARELYSERQRKKLEFYLQHMIRWLIFRPDSTRLCKFLELSALSMRLSVEGGYHGKEGLLSIISKAKIGRRPTAPSPASMIQKPIPKWFMVRHSYVIAVDSPESLEPREVFLVDSNFTTDKASKKRLRDQTAEELAKTAGNATQPKHHIIRLYNAERKLKLLAKNERQWLQFQESIDQMQRNTIWSKNHRFDSFAPIRKNVFARWLVDARDHMWQVSRAIDNARSFVYIHDWWLSPELYLRRPAAISQRWRLDRLLLRKAQEGVKIFVIVYRNIESAIPIMSDYTKASLLDLHPNVCVQRSPNQFRQNQFFWAHHEKLVVIDNAMAFVGGVDLCFGRWDDPHHALADDKLTGFELDLDGPRNADNCQVWPGKDYSNPRVQDFYALDRPYEEMYDRTKVPRMPWHDIAMTIVGQPARDVARHFVQRWNYILRQRVPSRPTPILLPPPEFDQSELDRLGMTGTCQVQILRSCTGWSIGTPNKTECSIMNAYVYLIENSEHFVYIENQFFITSTVVENTPVVNKIGDALVERIERAHENGEQWRACLIIPLMPGFQNQVDSQDGTSVRLIMQCQYRSICRGEESIFGRLRAKGIDPTQYIEFYALRQWGKIGPRKCLTTEQLYIHAKCMVVDDRSVIIGSANINERSMLGSRDSEVAAIVTDQEMLPSFMGGKPYDVGTFPHTLRMRLMREHLGIDVDEIYRREQEAERPSQDEEMDRIYTQEFTPPASPPAQDLTEANLQYQIGPDGKAESLQNWVDQANGGDMDDVSFGKSDKSPLNHREHDLDVAGYGPDNMKQLEAAGNTSGRDTYVNAHATEVLRTSAPIDHAHPRASDHHHHHHHHPHTIDTSNLLPPTMPPRMNTRELGLTQLSQLPPLPVEDDTDIGGPPLTKDFATTNAHIINPLVNSMMRPVVEEDCMKDPLVDSFYKKVWHQVAENNTRLYRQVFRCMPDSEVQSWREYREYNTYNEKFMLSQGLGTPVPMGKPAKEAPDTSGPPGSGGTDAISSAAAASERASKTASQRFSGLSKLFARPSTSHSTLTVAPAEIAEKARMEQSSRASESPTAAAPEEDLDEKTQAPSTTEGMQSPVLGEAPPPSQRVPKARTIQFPDIAPHTNPVEGSMHHAATMGHSTSTRRRKRANTKGSMRASNAADHEILEKEEAEGLMKLVQGHLVSWPYDWLEREEKGGNWLYQIDQLAPLEIYN